MSECLETTALPFGMRDSRQQPFFSVNAGISLEDALGSVRNAFQRRPGKAKTGEEAEFTCCK